MHDGYDSFDEMLAHELSPDVQRKALKQRAIALLARRDHSRAELARKLLAGPPPPRRRQRAEGEGQGSGRARSYTRSPADEITSLPVIRASEVVEVAERTTPRPSPALVESVLDELVALKFLSDERMAESLVRSASARFGSARLAQDMQRKGLAEGLVAEVLAPLADTEQERAQELWNRRFGKAPVDMKERARQYRFLMSRGFSARVVSAVVPRTTGSTRADDDDEFPD